MKPSVILLLLCIFSGSICYAQGTVANRGNAVSTSEIRVIIPSFAVIDLAENRSKPVNDNVSANLTNIKPLSATKVEANEKWAVNVIKIGHNNPLEQPTRKNSVPTYTVIYVTTQI